MSESHAASSASRFPPGTPVDAPAAIDALEAATRAIAGELDLERVLQLIVDGVRDLVEARYAALGIVDDRGRIERFITSGITLEERARIGPLPQGHGLLGLIVRDARAYRIPEIDRHPDASGFPPNHPPMRSFLGLPVRTGGRPMGNFYLTDKLGADEFSEDDQRLVELFALHAAIAIQNARLHGRVSELAIVDERLRIGRDLHDGIIQGLYAVVLSLEDVPELMAEDVTEATARVDRAIDRLTSTIGEIRTFVMGLGGDAADMSLEDRLAALVEELRLGSGPSVRIDLHLEARAVATADAALAPEAVSQLLLIAREALSNAVRHSGAASIRLGLHLDGDELELTVVDEGRGFDARAPRGAGHLGLANLHDRAASLGGTLLVDSRPGGGSRIVVRVRSS